MTDLVSVVIPTYNRNDLLLGRSLPSVLGQTHDNLEVLIVADGMEGAALDELAHAVVVVGDERVSFLNIPRQQYPDDPGERWMVLGLDARNYGLDLARGDWIASLDDDDEWTPDHVEVLLAAALRDNVDFAYGMSQYHWPDGHYQTAGAWPPGHFQFCDGSQAYRNGMGYRYDMGCIERGLPEDGDLWDRMVAGGVTFTFVPQILHHYWVNPR